MDFFFFFGKRTVEKDWDTEIGEEEMQDKEAFWFQREMRKENWGRRRGTKKIFKKKKMTIFTRVSIFFHFFKRPNFAGKMPILLKLKALIATF